MHHTESSLTPAYRFFNSTPNFASNFWNKGFGSPIRWLQGTIGIKLSGSTPDSFGRLICDWISLLTSGIYGFIRSDINDETLTANPITVPALFLQRHQSVPSNETVTANNEHSWLTMKVLGRYLKIVQSNFKYITRAKAIQQNLLISLVLFIETSNKFFDCCDISVSNLSDCFEWNSLSQSQGCYFF